jgi:hypothetical protein
MCGVLTGAFAIGIAQANSVTMTTDMIVTAFSGSSGFTVSNNSVSAAFDVDTTANEIISSSLLAIVNQTDGGELDGYYTTTNGSFNFTGPGRSAEVVNGNSHVSIYNFEAPWVVGTSLQGFYSTPVADVLLSVKPDIPSGTDSRQSGSVVSDEITAVSVTKTPPPGIFTTALVATGLLGWHKRNVELPAPNRKVSCGVLC